MPESAIASGCIDFVLSPEDIAKQLVNIARGEMRETQAINLKTSCSTTASTVTRRKHKA
jgi:hypothetical protein